MFGRREMDPMTTRQGQIFQRSDTIHSLPDQTDIKCFRILIAQPQLHCHIRSVPLAGLGQRTI